MADQSLFFIIESVNTCIYHFMQKKIKLGFFIQHSIQYHLICLCQLARKKSVKFVCLEADPEMQEVL